MKRLWIALVLGLVACGDAAAPDSGDTEFASFGDVSKADTLTLGESEIEGVLELVNTSTLLVLDDEVGLDARAAAGIVAFRVGPDKRAGTSDDRVFTSLAELDDVPYVGPKALEAIVRFMRAAEEASPACFMISEYIEGAGNYTKGVEIFNCGASRHTRDIGLCLVRNGDTECSNVTMLDGRELGPQSVVTGCRSLSGAADREFVSACEQELGLVASFNGDDRLVLFQDVDGDAALSTTKDVVLDIFGALKVQPDGMPWKDVILRRKSADHFDNPRATSFETLQWYTSHPATDFSDFGVAPRFRYL